MKTIIVAAAALIFSLSASAQNMHRANVRQTARVQQGVRCGTITPREHKAIARQRHDVRLAVQVAKADGRITPAERNIIRRERMQASNTIYRAKNNGRNRF